MVGGFLMVPTASACVPVKWYAGTYVQGWFKNYGSGEEERELQVFRCRTCGRIELFAN
jgi:hypothetical protein